MDLFSAVDNYCERAGPGLLAEPLNLFSNIAYLIVAYIAHKRIRREGIQIQGSLLVLLTLTYAVGPASATFHTFAQVWAMIVDITPIGLFFNFYFLFVLRTVYGFSVLKTLLGLGLFITVTVGFFLLVPNDLANGSQMYLGGLLGAFVLAKVGTKYNFPEANRFNHLGLLLFVALVFRTIDSDVCSYLPTGTHYIWHCSTALVTWLAIDIAISYFATQRTGEKI
jgi:hypothetical protein